MLKMWTRPSARTSPPTIGRGTRAVSPLEVQFVSRLDYLNPVRAPDDRVDTSSRFENDPFAAWCRYVRPDHVFTNHLVGTSEGFLPGGEGVTEKLTHQ